MGNWQIDSYSLLSQGNSYARIDIVLDRYQANSLQENTRTQYSKKQKAIKKMIANQEVLLPQYWCNFMACGQNKSEYTNILSIEMKQQAPNDK